MSASAPRNMPNDSDPVLPETQPLGTATQPETTPAPLSPGERTPGKCRRLFGWLLMRDALARALETFELVERHAHDVRFGGSGLLISWNLAGPGRLKNQAQIRSWVSGFCGGQFGAQMLQYPVVDCTA